MKEKHQRITKRDRETKDECSEVHTKLASIPGKGGHEFRREKEARQGKSYS